MCRVEEVSRSYKDIFYAFVTSPPMRPSDLRGCEVTRSQGSHCICFQGFRTLQPYELVGNFVEKLDKGKRSQNFLCDLATSLRQN